jgi:hypothetical protein
MCVPRALGSYFEAAAEGDEEGLPGADIKNTGGGALAV